MLSSWQDADSSGRFLCTREETVRNNIHSSSASAELSSCLQSMTDKISILLSLICWNTQEIAPKALVQRYSDSHRINDTLTCTARTTSQGNWCSGQVCGKVKFHTNLYSGFVASFLFDNALNYEVAMFTPGFMLRLSICCSLWCWISVLLERNQLQF